MTDLKLYRVSLKEEPGDRFLTVFFANAEDADHAEEQAEDFYPGCVIESVFEVQLEDELN